MRSHLAYFQRYWNTHVSSSCLRISQKKKRKMKMWFHAILENPRNPELIREPGWFRVDSTIIHGASHRIVSRDEKTHSFLNMFQLKSQSFVTLGSISLCPLFRLSLRYPLLSCCIILLAFSEAADPFYFWLLPLIKRRKKREKSVSGFFVYKWWSNYFTASFLKH